MTTITIDCAVLKQAVEALECVCNDERTCNVLGHRRNEYHVIGAECPAVKRLWVAAHKLRAALNAPSSVAATSNDAGQAPKVDAQLVPLQHKHEWIRTGAMQSGKYRCISCGVWNHENFETPKPVKREWVGLTYREIINIAYNKNTGVGPMTFASAIEQALKQRNHE